MNGMEALRPNSRRAKNAITFFWIALIFEVLSAASGYLQWRLFVDIQNGVEVSEAQAGMNDLRELVIALVFIVVYLTAIVLFLMWFRRASYNLRLRANHIEHKDAEAVYSWFIPFANLWWPFKIMRELYTETKFILERSSIAINRTFSGDFLGIWWALWIINGIVSQVTFRITMNAETVDQLMTATRVGIASNFLGVLATLAVIKVVNDYSKVEPMISQVPAPVPA